MSAFRFPAKAMRELILHAIPERLDVAGETPDPRHMYIPPGHVRALQPDVPLVTGIRGAGKSFWWAVLASAGHREILKESFPLLQINVKDCVTQGFGAKKQPDQYPSKEVIAKLLPQFADSKIIWRGVVIWQILHEAYPDLLPTLERWQERIAWVDADPELVDRLLAQRDESLDQTGTLHWILFDALDQTADTWPEIRKLLRGLMRVLLEFRYYRAIKLKAFLRPDMVEDKGSMTFPDASKLLADKVALDWPRMELFQLFWHYLANVAQGDMFCEACAQHFKMPWTERHGIWFLTPKSARGEDPHRALFHAMAGQWMGTDARRGFPFTWLPNHLGDALGQVSPRSFLAALRHAAADVRPEINAENALHYESIKKGVQEASKIRVNEMREDYPWVSFLMEPLQGLSVPCDFQAMVDRWSDANTLEDLPGKMRGEEGARLPPAHLDHGPDGVSKDLEALGIFYRMQGERINIPDVYRVGYGLGRRGGVRAVR